jgi:uncharacterized Tic20 family protein
MSAPQPPERAQGYGPPPPGYGYGPPPPEDNVWSVLVHLSIFVFALLAPLVMFLVVKNDPRKPMTRHHSLEALNFHLTMTLAGVVAMVLLVLGLALPELALVVLSILVIVGVYIASMVMAIIAAVAAGKRQPYRYPMTIRVIR